MEEGCKILIDTGAPATIHNSDSLRFMGTGYTAETNYLGLTIEKLSELLGKEITTLLGCDLLSKYKILFDYNNKSVIFSDENIDMEGTEIPIALFMGIPVIELIIGDKKLKFYLDSGAKLSYLNKEFTENLESAGIKEDFHPGAGKFKTFTYDIFTGLGDFKFKVKYGNLPDILQLTFLISEIDGIIGQDFFNNFKILLDIGSKKLKYKPV